MPFLFCLVDSSLYPSHFGLWLIYDSFPFYEYLYLYLADYYIYGLEMGLLPIFNLLCNHPKGVTCEIPHTLLVLSSSLAKATALGLLGSSPLFRRLPVVKSSLCSVLRCARNNWPLGSRHSGSMLGAPCRLGRHQRCQTYPLAWVTLIRSLCGLTLTSWEAGSPSQQVSLNLSNQQISNLPTPLIVWIPCPKHQGLPQVAICHCI